MGTRSAGIILVGHGAIPKDFPAEQLQRWRTLRARSRATGTSPSSEEAAIEEGIRHWPRTPHNDPYRAGLEALVRSLRSFLHPVPVHAAYNEFCAPTVQSAIAGLVRDGSERIVVVPSMLTPGGSHSEHDIPRSLDAIRTRHPGISITYAWPVEPTRIAAMLSAHLDPFLDRPLS